MLHAWVKRTDSSSYFPPHFHDMEKRALEALPGVRYAGVGEDVPEGTPVVLLTNTHTRLNDWAKLRPRTLALLHPNSGFDNLLPDLPMWPGVPVLLGNPVRAQAVAQWTLGALLQHVAPVRHHSAWPTSRAWNRPLLADKKVLLVGHGHVGRILQAALSALGNTPTVHDPWQDQRADLSAGWDVVVVAASLNQENHGLLGADFFARSPEDLLLLNPARGELVDEAALREFLSRHPHARAYLDTHAVEPYPTGHWDDCPGVTATPHAAGVWEGLVPSMLEYEARTLVSWLADPVGFAQRHPELLLGPRLTPGGWFR